MLKSNFAIVSMKLYDNFRYEQKWLFSPQNCKAWRNVLNIFLMFKELMAVYCNIYNMC